MAEQLGLKLAFEPFGGGLTSFGPAKMAAPEPGSEGDDDGDI